MTDRDYAIKSMKEITFQMASHAQDYLEVTIERHYTDIKELMTSYQKLILENQVVLEAVSYTHLYRMLEIKSTIISEMEKIQPRCYLTISEMSIYTKHTEIDKTLC